MGRTVTPLSFDFAGSNPALPTSVLNVINHDSNDKKWSFCVQIAGVAQLVERQPSKLKVAGSNPVSRSKNIDSNLSVGWQVYDRVKSRY